MKSYFKYVAIVALLTVGAACEKKSTNSEPQAVSVAADPSADPLASNAAAVSAQAIIAPSGGAVTTSTVVAHEANVGEAPASNEAMSWDEIIVAYPALADRVHFLASIDKVVETDARTFDLYSGGNIVLTVEYTAANDALVVKNSAHAGFAADLITVESIAAEQSQGKVADRLDFVMSSCDIVKEEPQQEQQQAQSGKETPSKEEQAKVEDPKQECASVVASLVLEQVVVKQEQEQKEIPAKEEPKQEAKQEPKQEAPVVEPKAPVQQEQK